MTTKLGAETQDWVSKHQKHSVFSRLAVSLPRRPQARPLVWFSQVPTEILVSVKYLSHRAAVKNMCVLGYKMAGFTIESNLNIVHTSHVPNTVLGAVCTVLYLTLMTTLIGRCYYYPIPQMKKLKHREAK